MDLWRETGGCEDRAFSEGRAKVRLIADIEMIAGVRRSVAASVADFFIDMRIARPSGVSYALIPEQCWQTSVVRRAAALAPKR
jgi:hypothetical protein